MKRIVGVLSLLASLAGGMAAPLQADLGGFRIESFHVDLSVRPQGELWVEERIEVEFHQARHGIYREIPVGSTDSRGLSWSLGFRLIEVLDESGKPYPTRVRRAGRFVHIRIGDPDRTLRGRQVYRLRYEVRNALRRFGEHEELYWNVTGNAWNTTIPRASATVRLPVAHEADSLLALAFVGRFGSREQAAEVRFDSPGVLSYVTTRALQPREGLTLVAAWPRGTVRFPGRAARAVGFLGDHWIVLIPLGFLMGLWRWYRRSGRDPGPFSVAVQYEPPPALSPGGVGTLVDEKVDLRDVTATIVDLAVRGYLTLRDEKKEQLWGLVSTNETIFERQAGKSDADLHVHEREVLQGIFESGDVVSTRDLHNKFYKKLPGIQAALYQRLVSQGLFAGDPRRIRRRTAGLGFLMALLTVGAGWMWEQWRGGILPQALFLPIASGVVTFGVFLLFAPAMPRRTHAGARLRAWALGFQEFTERVEKHRLEMDEARSVFERLLPYALALGVATPWARKFEGVYAEHAPSWYVGPQASRGFSTRVFEQSLSSSMNRVGQSLAASPRSSGSGGGGVSGGGSGGGGGGSW